MSTTIDPDGPRSASHTNMFVHLPGPLAGGAVESPLEIDASGRVSVTRLTREPLVLVGLRAPRDTQALMVRATLAPGTSEEASLGELTFASFTEAGAFLLLHRPEVAASQLAAPFIISLTLDLAGPIAASAIAEHVEVRLVEGVLGKVIWLLGSEKARLRREGREVAAMRHLVTARDDALDRIGAELAVPRLAEAIRFDADAGEIVTETYPDGREPDVEYRRRLTLYRPFLMPNRKRVLELLNGPGGSGDPNRGLLGQLGLSARLDIAERDNPFAVAIHLVGTGSTHALGESRRLNFLQWLRATQLVAPGAVVPATRYLPSSARDHEQALRDELATLFQWTGNQHVMPALASALVRAGRCRAALGVATPWPILRAQDDAGTSRFELGLGVSIDAPPLATWTTLADNLAANTIAASASDETRGLLAAMEAPANLADDPDGRWFFSACGLSTVHRIANDDLYLSHFPVLGLEITGPRTSLPHGEIELVARLHASGDSGANAVLASALSASQAAWVAGGGEALTVLSDAQALAAWNIMIATVNPPREVFASAYMPAVVDPSAVRTTLVGTAPELIETVQVGPVLAAAVKNGDPQAVLDLRHLLDIFASEHLVSALPFVTSDGRVLIVVGVVALPLAGLNLAGQRATGFRWFAVPVGKGASGYVHSVGSKTMYHGHDPGLMALVVLSYARSGATDPYEIRAELPDDALLDLPQYELLMNLLDHAHALGVEVNTWALRKHHVDLKGGGAATPLSPSVARTYRPFRRKRHIGERSVTLDDNTN